MSKWMLTENEITKICGWPSTPVYNMIAETNKAQAKKLLEYLIARIQSTITTGKPMMIDELEDMLGELK